MIIDSFGLERCWCLFLVSFFFGRYCVCFCWGWGCNFCRFGMEFLLLYWWRVCWSLFIIVILFWDVWVLFCVVVVVLFRNLLCVGWGVLCCRRVWCCGVGSSWFCFLGFWVVGSFLWDWCMILVGSLLWGVFLVCCLELCLCLGGCGFIVSVVCFSWWFWVLSGMV